MSARVLRLAFLFACATPALSSLYDWLGGDEDEPVRQGIFFQPIPKPAEILPRVDVIDHPTLECRRKCAWIQYNTFYCREVGCTQVFDTIEEYVKGIDMSDNLIQSVPHLPYPNLKRLDLRDNNISSVQRDAFSELDALQTLHLENNQLEKLDDTTFRGLGALRQLYLQHNRLTYVPNVFFRYLKRIERIDLSANLIKGFSTNAFSDLSSLHYLHLQNNLISELTSMHFLGLRALNSLGLRKNNLSEVAGNSFMELEQLQRLDLSYNKISNLQGKAFFGLYRLQRLQLQNNELLQLSPRDFEGLPVLQELYLGHQDLQDLGQKVLPASLIKLDLTALPKLTRIRNGTFSGMPELNKVYISGCPRLDRIEVGAFSGADNIKVINLRDNHLQTLEKEVLPWEQLGFVDLSGNPWDCDCHLEWMRNVSLTIRARNIITCDTPLSLRGRKLGGLTHSDFRCVRAPGVPQQTMTLDRVPVQFRKNIPGMMLVLFFTVVLVVGLLMLFIRFCHKEKETNYQTIQNAKKKKVPTATLR